jgi:hypothetical protein
MNINASIIMAGTNIYLIAALIIYLFALGIIFYAIGADNTFEQPIGYTTAEQSISESVIGNIVTGVSSVPWWFNTIFFTIPFIILGVIIVTHFLP